MTGTEIKAYAEAQLKEAIDDSDALKAINEALMWLSDTGLVYGRVSGIIASANVWYALPSGITSIIEVVNSNGDIYTDWRVQDGNIIFGDADTYVVHYRRQPNLLTTLTETPEIHEAFHGCLITYLKGWMKLQDDDENLAGLNLINDFKNDATRTFTMLRRKRGPKGVTVFRAAVAG